MVGARYSNDGDAYPADYHSIARQYHRAAVHEYRQGRHQEAQRLAELALANRAKAHARLLEEGQAANPAAASFEGAEAYSP